MLKNYFVEQPGSDVPYVRRKAHSLREIEREFERTGVEEPYPTVFSPREIKELGVTLLKDGHLKFNTRTTRWHYSRWAQYQYRNKRWKQRGRKNYPVNQYFFSALCGGKHRQGAQATFTITDLSDCSMLLTAVRVRTAIHHLPTTPGFEPVILVAEGSLDRLAHGEVSDDV